VTIDGGHPPPTFNFTQHCLAGKPPEKLALYVAGAAPASLSYGRLEESVLRLAQGLRQEGIQGGRRLFIRMESGLDFALLFFAANAAGGVPLPISPLLTERENTFLIADAQPWAVAWDGILALPQLGNARLLGPRDLDRLKRSPPGSYAATSRDDPAFLVYTSGSTGRPKGVLHAQRSIWGRRPMYRGWYGLSSNDVLPHTGALNWTYTLGTGLADPFVCGATAVVYSGPRNPSIWGELARNHGATLFASVPGLYRQILKAGFNPGPTLRHGLTAGEALPPATLSLWRRQTGLDLYEAMGMSEISTYISSGPSVSVKPGSPGRPQEGRTLRLDANGQLEVHRSDPGLMLGYVNEPSLSEDWFATGDFGHFDADGYFWHEGRKDELMNAGGYRVSPAEVEGVLAEHPMIAEAAVREIVISDALSIIGAFVVPLPGNTPGEKQILDFLRKRLAAYKCPKQIWFRSSLPRSANGKILRRLLLP
jgi:acyl-coenzyme A synthetase/AMP-(fatty) acid ligase